MSQQAKEEKKTLYALYILRRDGDHISVVESLDYDEVYESYLKLTTQWSECIKENRPFSLKVPVVTSFDPGLIYEITVKPVIHEQTQTKYDNPYQQEMIKKGFSGAFGNKGDLLDGGYR